ncbi:NPC intracellular cholesterol transporter 2 homolog a [Phymastichus coffea]|uniref:NPC intracellular cholesterol transporter 2 homolog a n=1 Tax=Phymastichus coffea TaxID=108790 RepID=UPI00273AAC3F|nr:NPC intracellular cholesterol transporter 2 homolog a [Phymastichus coffea]
MRLLTILLAALCAAVRAVEFKDCGSTSGQFDKVEVSNCDLSSPACILQKGTDASIGLHFTPNKATSRVTAVVHGIIEDIDVPFPIPNAEACFDNHSGVTCPLPAGTGTSYHATLPVLTKYPTVSVVVKWELKDEKGDNIVCVEIPVSLK